MSLKQFLSSVWNLGSWSALRWSLVILAGMVSGAFTWGYLFNKKSERHPTNLGPITKMNSFNGKISGKANALLNVKVTAPNGVPESDTQELVLNAEVFLNGAAGEEIVYNWALPEDAKIVQGQISDSWIGVQPGQTANAEIRLLNVSKESAKVVTFHVSTVTKGARMGGLDTFSTSNFETTNAVKFQKLNSENSASNPKIKIIY
jgi:hypothetical protein